MAGIDPFNTICFILGKSTYRVNFIRYHGTTYLPAIKFFQQFLLPNFAFPKLFLWINRLTKAIWLSMIFLGLAGICLTSLFFQIWITGAIISVPSCVERRFERLTTQPEKVRYTWLLLVNSQGSIFFWTICIVFRNVGYNCAMSSYVVSIVMIYLTVIYGGKYIMTAVRTIRSGHGGLL